MNGIDIRYSAYLSTSWLMNEDAYRPDNRERQDRYEDLLPNKPSKFLQTTTTTTTTNNFSKPTKVNKRRRRRRRRNTLERVGLEGSTICFLTSVSVVVCHFWKNTHLIWSKRKGNWNRLIAADYFVVIAVIAVVVYIVFTNQSKDSRKTTNNNKLD